MDVAVVPGRHQGRVRVVADDGECLRACRRVAPVEFRRDVDALAGVLARNRAAIGEGGAAQLHGRQGETHRNDLLRQESTPSICDARRRYTPPWAARLRDRWCGIAARTHENTPSKVLAISLRHCATLGAFARQGWRAPRNGASKCGPPSPSQGGDMVRGVLALERLRRGSAQRKRVSRMSLRTLVLAIFALIGDAAYAAFEEFVITSDPGDGYYAAGDAIDIRADFDETVEAHNDPELKLRLNIGTAYRLAAAPPQNSHFDAHQHGDQHARVRTQLHVPLRRAGRRRGHGRHQHRRRCLSRWPLRGSIDQCPHQRGDGDAGYAARPSRGRPSAGGRGPGRRDIRSRRGRHLRHRRPHRNRGELRRGHPRRRPAAAPPLLRRQRPGWSSWAYQTGDAG